MRQTKEMKGREERKEGNERNEIKVEENEGKEKRSSLWAVTEVKVDVDDEASNLRDETPTSRYWWYWRVSWFGLCGSEVTWHRAQNNLHKQSSCFLHIIWIYIIELITEAQCQSQSTLMRSWGEKNDFLISGNTKKMFMICPKGFFKNPQLNRKWLEKTQNDKTQ